VQNRLACFALRVPAFDDDASDANLLALEKIRINNRIKK
jgi:hypothetical protein